jgi:hypothetical protein
MNMKKLLFIILCMLPAGIMVAQDLTVDEIISKNLKAIGQDKLMTIKTIKTTGKMTQEGMEILMTGYEKRPDFEKAEMEVQGVKIIYVREGKTGWTINPMTGSSDPQDLPAETINNMLKESISDPAINWDNPFYTWKEIGAKVELVGKEEMDGAPVYNLKFTFKDGYVINYYVDAGKFLVIKSKSTETAQGQTYEKEIRYSDFKDLDGVLYPVKGEILKNGQVGSVATSDKVEFNLSFDDSIFKRPVKN